MDEIAADLTAILDQEKIEQAHVYGSSVGALYTSILVINYPKRFIRFIMQSTIDTLKTILRNAMKDAISEPEKIALANSFNYRSTDNSCVSEMFNNIMAEQGLLYLT